MGGVFAPRLITADTVRTMKSGSMIVDLAADGGWQLRKVVEAWRDGQGRRRHHPGTN